MEERGKQTRWLDVLLPSLSWALTLVSLFALIFLFRGAGNPMLFWLLISYISSIIFAILGLVFTRGASRQWSLWSLIAALANAAIFFSLSSVLSGIRLS